MAIGTLLQGFCCGSTPGFGCILTGVTFSLPNPVNTFLYLASTWSFVIPFWIFVGSLGCIGLVFGVLGSIEET